MMCDARLWRHQVTALSDLVTVHHGDLGLHDTVADIAAFVLAKAPQTFALAGLSMGGIVAMEMLRQAPERIERLALLDTNFRPDTKDKQAVRDRQIEAVGQGSLASVLRDDLKPGYLAECHRSNATLLSEVLAMGLNLGPEVFKRQALALRNRPDSTATLKSVRCSTLLLCGDEDRLCPPLLHEQMAALIPNARLAIIPDCGHLSTLEQPEIVNDLMRDWLIQKEN